jgi:hypothetical protein
MPIDASIISRLQPFQLRLNDPIESYGKSLALKGLIKKDTDEQAISDAYRQSGGNPETLRTLLYGAGQHQAAQSVEKMMLENKAKQSTIDMHQSTLGLNQRKMFDLAMNASRAELPNVRTYEDAVSWKKSQFSDPAIGPILTKLGKTIEGSIAEIPQNDPVELQRWAQKNNLGMEKFMNIMNREANAPFTVGPDGKPVANQPVQDFQINRAQAGVPARVAIAQAQLDAGAQNRNASLGPADQQPAPRIVVPGAVAPAPAPQSPIRGTAPDAATAERMARELDARGYPVSIGVAPDANGVPTLPPVLGNPSAPATPSADVAPVDNRSARERAKGLSGLSSINPAHANLRGEQYLATLPQGMSNIVGKLISYDIPITALNTRTGERRVALEHAIQTDPNFSVPKYGIRYGVMQDFTKGKTADNITALDQALNHMGTLSELAKALNNNDLRLVNAVVNKAKEQLGDPTITNYQTAQSAVGTELMRVFRQVNASEQETKDWISKFPLNGSPAQIQGSLVQGAKLLDGRINALNNRWNNGMDTTGGYPKVLSPEAVRTLESFGVRRSGAQTQPQRRASDTTVNPALQQALDRYKN